MLKSEKHTVEVLTSDFHEEKHLRRAAEKGKREADLRADALAREKDALQTQLTAKIDEISSLMQQMVQFMMGNGVVYVSESMKDSVIAGVRAEFERRASEIRESYELQIAALRND